MISFILFASLFFFILVNVPIAVSLGLAALIILTFFSKVPVVLLAQNAFTSVDSFPLMAIPFFMLAGSLMSYGGVSRRLLNLADAMVGFLTGGLAMVTTVACMFFAAISGSGPATVAAIGSFMIPAMEKDGYDKGFAAAISAAAGSIGVIIPPSIPFVLYGVVSGASIGAMFLAGVLPGLLIGLGLMATTFLIAKRNGYSGAHGRVSPAHLARAFKEAFWALLIPVIILGGIYGGVFTPTEAAVVAVVYGLVVGFFIYKELNWATIYQACKEAVLINGSTMIIIGLSISFANLMTMEQVPVKIANAILAFSQDPLVVLLIINLFLLFVGCFIDTISALVVLSPILLPVVTKLGVDPIHFGVIVVANLALGFVTPPLGVNLFVASGLANVSLERISRAVIPLIVSLVISLLLITFIPSLSLWLPNTLLK